jgi:CheY-like chemotaxis protein
MGSVLIVEDEPTVLLLAESILQDAGHQTLTASSLSQAMAVIAGERRIDLLFTDIGLGDAGEGGLELARQARDLHPRIRVLYVTGQIITDGMRELFVEGSDVLAKPYDTAGLTGAVGRLLEDLQ